MKRCGLILFVFCVGSLSARSGHALIFNPIKLELSPSGPGATGTFVVQNNTKAREAIEIFAAVRAMDLDGKETNPEAEDNFLVYPPQMVLAPGEERNVRVTWIGDRTPRKELAFRLICEQLPVSLAVRQNNVGGNIRLLVRYSASVYIIPKGVQNDVVVAAVSNQKSDKGADTLVITLENKGKAHALLKDLVVRLTPPGSKIPITLTKEHTQAMNGENILAESKRRFVLPWPDKLPVAPVKVEIDFDRRH
jgi:fimbrial chaperone protein